MKVGVATLCYNEEETIGAVLKNWKGKVYRHVVFHSDKPWHGQELPHDRTEAICRQYGAEFVRMPWRSETEQRNWANAYLHQCDYVLPIDADELMTLADQTTLLRSLGTPAPDGEFYENTDCYRCSLITYFKTPDYILDPPDRHKPVIAINPKTRLFVDCRIPSTQYQIPLPVNIHHLTYLRSDLRLWHKLQQFEHHDQVRADWFEGLWKKWEPGMQVDNVRAYGYEKSGTARAPMPQELRDLLL